MWLGDRGDPSAAAAAVKYFGPQYHLPTYIELTILIFYLYVTPFILIEYRVKEVCLFFMVSGMALVQNKKSR